MTVAKIKLLGKEYPACLSTEVMINIQDKTEKAFTEGINELLSMDNIDGMFWLLAEMLEAGKKYYDLIGKDAPEPPNREALKALTGFDDYQALVDSIYSAATTTTAADVDVETDEKN